MKKRTTFLVYQDNGGYWRWTSVSSNSQKTAASGESFHSKGNAFRAARRFIKCVKENEVVVKEFSRD